MSRANKNPIDAHVGGRVKLTRVVTGKSQTELAKQLGITFQQIQKYENGANRIGSSRLYLIATILNVPIQSFFEGLDTLSGKLTVANGNKDTEKQEEFIRSSEGINLCKSIINLEDETVRERIIDLVKSVSEARKPSR